MRFKHEHSVSESPVVASPKPVKTKNCKNFYAFQKVNYIVSIKSRINRYAELPSKSLQRKLDYYITPYNNGLIYKKHMSFGDEEPIDSPVKSKSQIINTFRKKRGLEGYC